jgi:hypothetical protein
MPTMETDSSGVMSSELCFRCRLLELFRRLGSSSDGQSTDLSRLVDLDLCLERFRNSCRRSMHGEATSSIGVAGFGVFDALPRRTCISFQTFVRCPKEGMSSSRRSSNFKVVKIAPEMSFSSNFSTIEGSKPASYIHRATCRGVHNVTSLKFKLSTASVSELRCRWRAGISGTRGASKAAICILEGLGVIGDIASVYWSSWKLIEESTELRNRWGPVGPSTAALAARPKSKPLNSLEFGLGVCTSSKEDIVVPLC